MTTTVVATPEPDNWPPRIRLDVTSTLTAVTLYRVGEDGRRTVVRSYDGGPLPVTGGTLVAYDSETHYGAPVTYTSDDAATTPSAAVTVDSTQPWLNHPGVPVLSQPITIAKISGREHAANQSVRYPLGSRFPIVASDGVRKAATYQLTVRTHTHAERDALDALLADLATLLLNVPAGLRWGVTAEYVSVGTLTAGRIVDWGPHPYREWQLPCTVTRRPAGGSRADITYGYSYGLYPTYADRFAAHATYGEAAGL